MTALLWIIGILIVLIGLLFIVYKFELDTALIKKIEPSFRKKQHEYRAKRGLE